MAVVGVADQYMIMLAITLLFTILALAYEKKISLGLLSAIAWFMSAIGHLAVGDKTSVLTSVLPWVFFLFGFLFSLRVTLQALDMFKEKRTWR